MLLALYNVMANRVNHLIVEQIDVNNAAAVKVLAVGKPTNILTQLDMTSDEYNWVQSIYYVGFIILKL